MISILSYLYCFWADCWVPQLLDGGPIAWNQHLSCLNKCWNNDQSPGLVIQVLEAGFSIGQETMTDNEPDAINFRYLNCEVAISK